jgi:putative tricarboxylic transport membrane protein
MKRDGVVLGRGLALLLGAIGLVTAAQAWRRIPLGTPDDPGPGLLPLALGLLVTALGAAAALGRAWPAPAALDGPRVLAVAAVVLAWALALPHLGFTVATAGALVVLGRALGSASWRRVLAFALLASAGAVALFRGLLALPLPRGPWGW